MDYVMEKPLEKEFKYYIANQADLLRKHQGKFLAIKDHTVLGAYDTEIEAIQVTSKEHPVGTFLVQKCEPGSESYTQTFHSRVAFA
jgi:hypothetical protein